MSRGFIPYPPDAQDEETLQRWRYQLVGLVNDLLSVGISDDESGVPGYDAQYVLMAAHAELDNERILTGTTNQITVTDGGAGGNATLSTPQDIDTSAAVTFGSLVLATPLAATDGGTGFDTYTLGDIIYSDATDSLAKLAGNTTTTRQYLAQTGNGSVSAAPAWRSFDGGDIITGTVAHERGGLEADVSAYDGLVRITGGSTSAVATPLAETLGGTNQSTYTAGDLLYSDAANSLAKLGIGTSTHFLTSSGTAPQWSDINDLTADGSPDTAADYVMTWDADAATHKKVLLDDLSGGGTSPWTDGGAYLYPTSTEDLAVGMTATAPNAGIEVRKTTEQLRLAYDATNYCSFTVDINGDLSIVATSGDLAIGSGSVSAAGADSIAIGTNADADNTNCIAIGQGADAINNSNNIGIGAVALARGSQCIAIGTAANVVAGTTHGIAIGSDATCSNAAALRSVAIGRLADVSGLGGVSIGDGSQCAGSQGIVIGDGASIVSGATQSVAIGTAASVSNLAGDRAVVIGQSATTNGVGSVAIGDAATANASQATAIGDGASASQDKNIAIGQSATASGNNNAIAIGTATASGSDSLAMMRSATASGSQSISIGTLSSATTVGGVAIGYNCDVTGTQYMTAVGYEATASTGTGGVCLGSYADSTATGAMALGYSTSASANYAVAIGYLTASSNANECKFGNATIGLDVVIDNGTLTNGGHGTTASAANCYIDSSTGLISRSTSSADSKRGIATLEPDWASFEKLRPVQFWDRWERTQHPGFLAEEWAQIYPNWVERDAFDRPVNVPYPHAVALLTAHIQDLHRRLKRLEIV